jgi:hypothetical protein
VEADESPMQSAVGSSIRGSNQSLPSEPELRLPLQRKGDVLSAAWLPPRVPAITSSSSAIAQRGDGAGERQTSSSRDCDAVGERELRLNQ